MKATGMTRPVDELGRVVIPKEIRRTLNIRDNKDALEIFVDGEFILFRKYQPGCIFCGSVDNVAYFKGKPICLECKAGIGAGKK